jgi:hypothetical protein
VTLNDLPILHCEFCDAELKATKPDNYAYECGNCNRSWDLPVLLPRWNELFQYSGLAIPNE